MNTYRRADFPFVMLPMSLLVGLNSAKEIAVYAAIMKHVNEKMECYPSRSKLAKEAGMSVKSLDATLKRMRDKGMVETSYRYTPDGRRTTNLYKLKDYLHVMEEIDSRYL